MLHQGFQFRLLLMESRITKYIFTDVDIYTTKEISLSRGMDKVSTEEDKHKMGGQGSLYIPDSLV